MRSTELRTSGSLRHGAQWTDPDGTPRAKYFTSLDAAQSFSSSIEQAIAAALNNRVGSPKSRFGMRLLEHVAQEIGETESVDGGQSLDRMAAASDIPAAPSGHLQETSHMERLASQK